MKRYTRYFEMPAFATLGSLTGEQIRDMTEYVLSLSGYIWRKVQG